MALRKIVGFHQDENGDWVAELECGHGQHVRHKPPWTSRPWVTTPKDAQRIWDTNLIAKSAGPILK